MNSTKQAPLTPVLMVNFIGTLGYSIILPFLVFLVTDFGGNEFIYGLVGAVYPAFQFFGAPLMGRWSDTYGRRKILFLSQLGTLIAWFIFMVALFAPKTVLINFDASAIGSFSLTIPLLILVFARAMDGITGGNVSVANAYLSDVSTEENRKTNFGKMAMSSSLGFILGPSIAGVLGATKYEEVLPVGAAILISMVALYVIWFKLPETKANLVKPTLKQFKIRKLFASEQKDCYEVEDCPDKGLKSVLKVKNIPFMLVIYFLTFLGFSFFYVSFPMHALGTLEWTAFELGIFFSIMSGLMILVQGPILSAVSKKTSEETLITIGSFLLVINFLLIGSTNILITYTSLVFFALGNGLMWPSFLSLVAKYAGKEQQGAVQGVANSAGSLASIVGLVLGGWLFGAVGNVTFYIAAILLLVIFVLSFRLFKLKKAVVKT
ncbi:MFS transporter [Roseivirga misakiensis]|uniref:MFS transporter n=1 Tax=Roseivirga misakiensis TaxID=1563681 RepID=A0A1E5SYU7_9BACT|nr:MFS transporter [Roseivirga misakiensis]OEK04304.1 MFS transporter [Roseivirga misakiensis]